MMQLRKHPAINPGHRFNPASVARQEFLRYRNTVVVRDQRGSVDTQVPPHGLHKVGLFHKRVAIWVWFVAAAVAKKVKSRDAITGPREFRYHVCPVERRRRKAMKKGYRLSRGGAISVRAQLVC